MQGNGNKGGTYKMLEGICLRNMGKTRGPGDTDVKEGVSEGQPPREEAAQKHVEQKVNSATKCLSV